MGSRSVASRVDVRVRPRHRVYRHAARRPAKGVDQPRGATARVRRRAVDGAALLVRHDGWAEVGLDLFCFSVSHRLSLVYASEGEGWCWAYSNAHAVALEVLADQVDGLDERSAVHLEQAGADGLPRGRV